MYLKVRSHFLVGYTIRLKSVQFNCSSFESTFIFLNIEKSRGLGGDCRRNSGIKQNIKNATQFFIQLNTVLNALECTMRLSYSTRHRGAKGSTLNPRTRFRISKKVPLQSSQSLMFKISIIRGASKRCKMHSRWKVAFRKTVLKAFSELADAITVNEKVRGLATSSEITCLSPDAIWKLTRPFELSYQTRPRSIAISRGRLASCRDFSWVFLSRPCIGLYSIGAIE